jgi:dTMP kinase
MIEKLNGIATGGLQPDLTVFLDIDPVKGLRRATDPNRFEAEGIEFQKKVRTGLMKSYHKNKKRFLRIKILNQSPEELAEIVLNEIKHRLRKKRRKQS